MGLSDPRPVVKRAWETNRSAFDRFHNVSREGQHGPISAGTTTV